MLPFWVHFWVQYSLLHQYEILRNWWHVFTIFAKWETSYIGAFYIKGWVLWLNVRGQIFSDNFFSEIKTCQFSQFVGNFSQSKPTPFCSWILWYDCPRCDAKTQERVTFKYQWIIWWRIFGHYSTVESDQITALFIHFYSWINSQANFKAKKVIF